MSTSNKESKQNKIWFYVLKNRVKAAVSPKNIRQQKKSPQIWIMKNFADKINSLIKLNEDDAVCYLIPTLNKINHPK